MNGDANRFGVAGGLAATIASLPLRLWKNMGTLRPGKMVKRMRSIPLGVKVAVFVLVLVAAMLPFVLRGTVASWAALAFVALIALVAVVGTLVEMVDAGRSASRASGSERLRVLGGIAVTITALTLVVLFNLRDGSDEGIPAGASQEVEEKAQKSVERIQDCQRTLPVKTCVQRFLLK